MCKCVAGTCVCCCFSCALSMLISVISFLLVIGIIIGVLFYFDVFGIQDTNKEATQFFTNAGDKIKETINKHT